MYPEYSLGKYLTLKDFCTCTQTYRRYYDKINLYPQTNIEETILALKNLHQWIIDPVIDYFGKDKFCLTYGFCSPDLKKWLSKKDPVTGQKTDVLLQKSINTWLMKLIKKAITTVPV